MNSYHNLFTKLRENTNITILTPNRRLAATLHHDYQHYRIEQGDECWQTADILPISTWLQRLWSEQINQTINAAPLLLTTTQESFIWEKIISKSKTSHQLLQVSETAELVRSAWGLLKQWQVDLTLPIFTSSEDYAALTEWITEFQKRCAENNWLDSATLVDVVIQKIQSKQIKLPNEIILIGFTEINPQLQVLFKHGNVSQYEFLRDEINCQRISLIDTEAEIMTLARWAKSLYSENTNISIGCVIPSLDKIRDRVQQLFSEVFTHDPSAFNISAGKNLPCYPIIHSALQLLNLHKPTISLDNLSEILASPFIGHAEQERLRRFKFDSRLRQDNISQIDLTKSIADESSAINKFCPRFAELIKNFYHFINTTSTEKTYHEWADIFSEALASLGWPGERSLSSIEYQIVENWLKVLVEFASLDQISAPVNYEQALHTLQKMISRAVFQPKTPQAPIQILGVLEAASIPFDYLWVAGMDDISWPPQPKPNPFIPKSLQRELHMPHATAERELMFCRNMVTQFKHGAAQVIFSHAEKNDELELQASPLIRNLPQSHFIDLHLPEYTSATEQIFASKSIEIIFDDTAPPVQDNEVIRGGVSVLKQQALCPFKAYAEWRLHARELEQPLPGLRPKDRGEIVHKILELIWNKLQKQAALIALDDTKLMECITRSIDETFMASKLTSHIDYPQYLSLEKQRLTSLIHDWLQIEKERPEFTVTNNEKNTQINIGPLKLNVRIDRIDELSDGTKMIIDYKTGKHNDINNWFSDRPEEPQLPLYSLLDRDKTSAISFAQVAQGENCFKGVSRYTLDIKGIKLIPEIKKAATLSWEDQLNKWQTILTKLSHDFHSGIATVNPKDPPQTCEWCSLQPLCRINEEA